MFSFDLRKKSKNFDTHDMHDTRVCANHYHTLPSSLPHLPWFTPLRCAKSVAYPYQGDVAWRVGNFR